MDISDIEEKIDNLIASLNHYLSYPDPADSIKIDLEEINQDLEYFRQENDLV
jgi:hypothetical protein